MSIEAPVSHGLPPDLEVSPFKITPQTVRLANQALSKTFPRQFGTVILPLRQTDIFLIKDESLRAYAGKDMTGKTHTVRKKMLADFIGKGVREISEEEEGFTNITDRSLPGNPIFILETELTDIIGHRINGEQKRVIQEVSLARLLIHEGMHHSVRPAREMPVSPQETLFGMAMSTDRRSAGANPHMKQAVEEIGRYAAANNPSVRIEAARVSLMCDDEDGQRRVIAMSGYDLEEAIVELIAQQSTRFLLKYAKGFPIDPRILGKALQNDFESMKSYRHANITSSVMPYLKGLGFAGLEDVINPFLAGDLPLIHASTGLEEYLP